jgi:DNA-binding transcriptional regulator LsrR (DeoR family)
MNPKKRKRLADRAKRTRGRRRLAGRNRPGPAAANINPYEVVSYYYRELAPEQRTQDNVADYFKIGVHRVGRIIREWENKGCVVHVVLKDNRDAFLLPRCPELEIAMRQAFKLRQAVVVNTYTLERTKRREEREKGDSLTQAKWGQDDELHKRLGAWAARMVASCLRPADVIGVGGGRGPYDTVEACDELRPGQATRYALAGYSLTGSFGVTRWQRSSECCDADDVLRSLAGTFGNVDEHYARCSICGPDWACRQDAWERPNVAIVGIGALGGGHRLVHASDYENLKHHGAVELVNRILEACKRLTPEPERGMFQHLVGDVCNWYFVVEELAHKLADQHESLGNLKEAIDQLNGMFMNTGPDALKGMAKRGMVIAVAGGHHKGAALWHVLRQNKNESGERVLTHLVTDDHTAEYVLRMEERLSRSASAGHRETSSEPLPA